jgi:hypothetical protein
MYTQAVGLRFRTAPTFQNGSQTDSFNGRRLRPIEDSYANAVHCRWRVYDASSNGPRDAIMDERNEHLANSIFPGPLSVGLDDPGVTFCGPCNDIRSVRSCSRMHGSESRR